MKALYARTSRAGEMVMKFSPNVANRDKRCIKLTLFVFMVSRSGCEKSEPASEPEQLHVALLSMEDNEQHLPQLRTGSVLTGAWEL